MSALTIGIDIGTTGTKAVLLEVGRGVIATASRPSELRSPQPGFAEADTAVWMNNIHACVSELMSRGTANPAHVVGIATSGMVPAVIPTDARGAALRPAILQNDARAIEQIRSLGHELASLDFVADTGSGLTQQSVGPTLMWLAEHEPDIWAQTKHVVGSYDWALMELGATAHVEHNWALESGLFYINGDHHTDIQQASGVRPGSLPPITRATEQVGELTASHAEQMGLPAGVGLFVGGADHVLSAYGAGVSQPGDWLIKLGGAGDILVNSASALVDHRLYLDAHPSPGSWLPNGCMATSGSLIRWFQALTGIEDLKEMDLLAEAARPASVLCLPYFLGEKSPLHDPDLRGMFFGMHLGTTKADLYRSVLEAIAFGFRHHRDIFLERGVSLERAMVTNGGSTSTVWKQIHADVLGTELHPVVDHPGASLGAAVIAGVGAGAIGHLDDIEHYITLGPTVTPDSAAHALYDEAYQEWFELSQVTTPLAHRLSERTR